MTANQPPETPPDTTHTNESFAGKSRNAASSVKLALRALDSEPVRTSEPCRECGAPAAVLPGSSYSLCGPCSTCEACGQQERFIGGIAVCRCDCTPEEWLTGRPATFGELMGYLGDSRPKLRVLS